MRWLEFLKDYDFDLSYHLGKVSVVVDALSRKSLRMSMLIVRELELIKKFRDMSLVCDETHNTLNLGMLKLASVSWKRSKKVRRSMRDRLTNLC